MEDPNTPLIPLGYPKERKPELTFGVEIEFVVATAPVNEIDPQPELWGVRYSKCMINDTTQMRD